MTSISAGHIILTPTQPVGSRRPQRGSNPGPPDQESRAYQQRALGMSDTRLTSRERCGYRIQDLPAESVEMSDTRLTSRGRWECLIQDLPAESVGNIGYKTYQQESVGDVLYKTYQQRALRISDTRLTSRERWECLVQDLPAETVADIAYKTYQQRALGMSDTRLTSRERGNA